VSALLRGVALSELALVAVLIFLSVCGGVWLSIALGRITAIWPANALLVYFLLKHPQRQWPALIAAAVVGHVAATIVMGDSPIAVVWLTYCNILGVLIVAAPIAWLRLADDFARPKPLCLFYALALGPAPLCAGLLSAIYFHYFVGRGYLLSVLDWYATDGLFYSIVVPVLMTVRARDLRNMFAREERFLSLVLLGVVAATILLNYLAPAWPLAFLFFPVVILVTFQRGFAGGALAVLMTGAYLMLPVLTSDPQWAHPLLSLREKVIIVQVFIAVMGFSVLLVGAALAERRRLEEGLASAIVRAESAREEAVVARDAAEQANRMKSTFLATMSHELRTPLNAIIGFSELMDSELHGAHSDPRYREYSGLIRNAGHHLLSLINDVLDMSKIEAGKYELHRESFDFRDVVRECLALMAERAAQGGVTLRQDIPASRLAIEADLRAVKQVLLNLLSNAIKFTPEGGSVTVGIREVNQSLALKVTDTGIGIPSDQLSRLGNPFVQLRSSAGATHEGTGLGLALVRALAEMHGGSFRIESTLGRGTTVTIAIPRRVQADQHAAVAVGSRQ